MINLNNKIITYVLSSISVVIFGLASLNLNNNIVSLLIFIYFSFIPGIIVLLNIKSLRNNIAKFSLLSISFSILIIYIICLSINTVGPLLHLDNPLAKIPLLILSGFTMYLLLIINYFKNTDFNISINLGRKTILKQWYVLLPIIPVITSITGTIYLTNTSNNILIVITLLLILGNYIYCIFFNQKVNSKYILVSIYFTSLAMLLMISLRSSYVTGWDIQHEFTVFTYTNGLNKWDSNYFKDAYNACLSITMFPTFIYKVTNYSPDYIYKILFQILFAFTPVIIYMTYKRYVKNTFALIGILYIVSQPLFIQPMTALIRQEIAFIFFVSMIYLIFEDTLNKKLRNILFLTLGLGMVLSHYSTTYVALILLLLTYSLNLLNIIFEFIFSKITFFNKYSHNRIQYKYFINPGVLLILLGFTLFWYGIINNQLGPIRDVLNSSFSKMNGLFKNESKSTEGRLATTFLKNDRTSIQDINKYVDTQNSQQKLDSQRLYSPLTYRYDNVYPITQNFNHANY